MTEDIREALAADLERMGLWPERATDADGAPLWLTDDGEVVSRTPGDQPPDSGALYTLVPGTDAVVWPEPGSHTAGLTGPFHRYAECTNDRCPIHPD